MFIQMCSTTAYIFISHTQENSKIIWAPVELFYTIQCLNMCLFIWLMSYVIFNNILIPVTIFIWQCFSPALHYVPGSSSTLCPSDASPFHSLHSLIYLTCGWQTHTYTCIIFRVRGYLSTSRLTNPNYPPFDPSLSEPPSRKLQSCARPN